MKKLLGVLALAVVGTACQHQATTTIAEAALDARLDAQTDTGMFVDGQEAAARVPTPRKPVPTGFSPAMRAFARRHDLSAIWQGMEEADTTGTLTPTVCNGFFGPDHYRIELVLLKVTRDAADPLLYQVQGKTRYKRQITPFAGSIRLQSLRYVPTKSFVDELQGDFARFYTALGRFDWRETGSAGSGIISGTVGIDFQQKADSSLVSTYFLGDDKQQFAYGDRLYINGEWTAPQSKKHKKLVAGADFEQVSHELFSDFNIGERGFTLNPKYAKLGWDNYWENDEWWADSPKPSLNL